MKRIFASLTLVALLVPLFALQLPGPLSAQETSRRTGPQSVLPLGFDQNPASPFELLDEARRPATQNQVRIEQRVIVRVSPAPPRARTQMMADLPRRPMPRGFQEVAYGDCIAVEDIVGIQPTSDNRLLFFTTGNTVLAATLGENCVARAFYSGFYVERSEDGRLCVARDQLQSRAGASCQVAEFSRLVAVSQ